MNRMSDQNSKLPWFHKLIPLVFLLLILAGCFKDHLDFDKLSTTIRLNPTFNTPLVYGSLMLRDVIKQDDSLIFHNEDNTINLIVREDSVFSMKVADILEIPDQDSVLSNFLLEPAMINDFTINVNIPLDSLIFYMDETLAELISSLDGQSAVFPSFSQQNLGEYVFDLIEEVDYVEFSGGNVLLTLTNNLPVAIQQINVDIINDFDDSIIESLSFTNLEPDSSDLQIVDLTGLLLYSQVEAKVVLLDIVGSYPDIVMIDLSDYLQLKMESDSITVIKGRAIIPDQVIHEQDRMIDLAFPDNADIAITDLHLKQAKLNYSLKLHADETFLVDVKLPGTTRNGSMVTFSLNTTGTGGQMSGCWDMSNTITDLTTDSVQQFNKIPVEYEISFISTGEMIEFDLTESAGRFIDIDFSDLEFELVKGYFGQQTININEQMYDIDFELIDKITGTSVFTDPELNVFYEHNFGIPVGLSFSLKGYSDGIEVILQHPQVSIAAAGFIDDVVFDTIKINKNTSGIVDYITQRPVNSFIEGTATSNPSGNLGQQNFIRYDSYFNVGLDFELPFNLQLINLILTDTLEFDLSEDVYNNLDKVILSLEVSNGFPVSVVLDLSFYDMLNHATIYTLQNIALLDAAAVDENGVVQSGLDNVSQTDIVFPADVFENMRNVDHIVITAILNTTSQGDVPVKLLTNYSIDFNIRSKFNLSL
jgi:hypothetical protein